jgi:O-antigen/teichoic acid export membrane protein
MEPDQRPVQPSGAPPEAGARRILAGTAYRALADLGSKAASIALFVVMARELGDAGFGVFTLGLSIGTLVTVLGGFGQDGILTREVARDHERVHLYFANTLALKALLLVPALAVTAAVTFALGVDSQTRAVILLLGVAVAAELFTATCLAVFQAYQRIGFLPVVLIFQRLVTAIVGVAALLAGAGVVAVSAIYLGGSIAALALAAALVFRRVVRPRLEIDPSRFWPLMWVALPVGIAGVFGTILFRVDTAILAAFEPDSVVGNYGGAFRLFEATLFLSWAVGTALYPVLSRLGPDSDPPAHLVFERGLKLALAATLPLALGAAVVGGPLATFVYGSDFEQAGDALRLLAPAIALYPVTHLASVLLLSQDRQFALAAAHGIVAVANVAANVVLISLFSLEGAAAAASLTQLLLAAGLLAAARGLLPHVSWPRVLAGPALAGGLAALGMSAFRDDLGPALAVGALVYVPALVLFERLAFPADARALWNFVRRRAE